MRPVVALGLLGVGIVLAALLLGLRLFRSDE